MRLVTAVLARVADPLLAESIVGDLCEERSRRAAHAPWSAALWFWATLGAMLVTAIGLRLREVGRTLRPGRFRPAPTRGDIRQAARALARTPWITATAVAVMALSLALALAVFAIVDGVLFAPMPYARPGELYYVAGWFRSLPATFRMSGVSLADLAAWSEAAPAVTFTAMSLGDAVAIADNDHLRTAEVDRRFFDLVGVQPLLGGFDEQDFAGKAAVQPALLLYSTWQSRFGGDPSILGRSFVASSGDGMRVAGVLPRTFVFPADMGAFGPEAVTPLPSVVPQSVRQPTRRWLQLIARLPAGMSPVTLADRLTAATMRVAAEFPPLPDDPSATPTRRITRGPFDSVLLRPLADFLTERTRSVSWAVFWTTMALLLLAAVNLAGLGATRAADRRGELVLRRALGSSGWQLVRLLAVEHAIVLAAGLMLGLGGAAILLRVAILADAGRPGAVQDAGARLARGRVRRRRRGGHARARDALDHAVGARRRRAVHARGNRRCDRPPAVAPAIVRRRRAGGACAGRRRRRRARVDQSRAGLVGANRIRGR